MYLYIFSAIINYFVFVDVIVNEYLYRSRMFVRQKRNATVKHVSRRVNVENEFTALLLTVGGLKLSKNHLVVELMI